MSLLVRVVPIAQRRVTAPRSGIGAAWTGRAEAFDIAARGRALAERLDDPLAIAWAELALAIVHGNDGPPRGLPVAVPARAIGRADPFQDNFVDTIGSVRARLTEQLGLPSTEILLPEGAAAPSCPLIRHGVSIRRT